MSGNVMSGWMDPEQINYLSGLFQQILEDCKAELPLLEEFIGKSQKLQSQLVSTMAVFGSFLDTAQKIADFARETKGSSANIGICLETIVNRHRVMEVHGKTLTSTLSDSIKQPVQKNLDRWRKKMVQLDKEHTKQFKKMRSVVKKRNEAVGKLRKKVKKRTKDQELVKQLEMSERELMSATEMFVENEKGAVEKIDAVERAIFSTFAVGWKHIISEEFEMLNQVAHLGDVIATIDRETLLPTNMLERSEYREDYTEDMNKLYADCTPKMSPYTAKLRSESCRSRNSVSSRHSSADSHIDDRRSTSMSLIDIMENEKCCLREDRYSLPIYSQEQQDLWLSTKAGSEEVLVAEISSFPLSDPTLETTESEKPSLPQRGIIPEPYYSVPQNNTRVICTTETMEDIPPVGGKKEKEVDTVGSDSCSSGYSSNDIKHSSLKC